MRPCLCSAQWRRAQLREPRAEGRGPRAEGCAGCTVRCAGCCTDCAWGCVRVRGARVSVSVQSLSQLHPALGYAPLPYCPVPCALSLWPCGPVPLPYCPVALSAGSCGSPTSSVATSSRWTPRYRRTTVSPRQNAKKKPPSTRYAVPPRP